MAEAEQQVDVGGPGADAGDRLQLRMHLLRRPMRPAHRDRAGPATSAAATASMVRCLGRDRPDSRMSSSLAARTRSGVSGWNTASTRCQHGLRAGDRELLPDDDLGERRRSRRGAGAAAAGRSGRSRRAIPDRSAARCAMPSSRSAVQVIESSVDVVLLVAGHAGHRCGRSRASVPALMPAPGRASSLSQPVNDHRQWAMTAMPSPAHRHAPVFRFAPSPNGLLHLGHALSALTNQAIGGAAGRAPAAAHRGYRSRCAAARHSSAAIAGGSGLARPALRRARSGGSPSISPITQRASRWLEDKGWSIPASARASRSSRPWRSARQRPGGAGRSIPTVRRSIPGPAAL